MAITATFPTITFPHRGAETKDVFVTAQETAQDLLSGDLTTNLNLFKTEANALETNVNAKEASAVAASAAAVAAANFKGTWTGQLTSISPYESWLYNDVIYMPLVAGTASPVTTPSNWFALTIAQAIKNIPAGEISATTVQAAINELDTEKAPKASPIITGGATISGILNLDSSLVFEGATVNANQITLTVTEPTADRTITFKDESGTVSLLSDISTSLNNLFHIQDQKASGVDGGTSVVGSNPRTLNTVLTNSITGASLATNQITLPAGTYYIEAYSSAYGSTGHKTRLHNVTDATIPLVGNPSGWVAGNGGTISHLAGTITIATTKVFSLSTHQSQAIATNGLGHTYATGDIEIYTDIKIWKVA